MAVHPVEVCPDHAEGYRLKYKRYRAESLQIFDTQEEAERAAAAEEIAAAFGTKSEEELLATFLDSVRRFKEWGISLETLCTMAGASRNCMAVYACRGVAPNHRVVAKFRIMADMFARCMTISAKLLPEDGGCGNPRKSRGGRPDIRFDAG